MIELLVLCTLQISGGAFYGTGHTEYVLTRSHAHCAEIAKINDVSPHFVSKEAIWFDSSLGRKYLAEICGQNLGDCKSAVNVPIEWKKTP